MPISILRVAQVALTFAAAVVVTTAFNCSPSLATAAETSARNQSGHGAFVTFQGGRLTLKGKLGVLVYDQVGENYKTYQNNEEGPGSRLVDTVRALSGEKLPGNITPLTRVLPGTLVRVNVEAKEIHFGFDYRIIGTFVSYRDGKLDLVAAEAPSGLLQIPQGNVSLSIDPSTPVLASANSDYLQFAGLATDVLSTTKPGELITARSQYDPDVIEVIEIGLPRYRLERYTGESRGPVRGSFISFQDDALRIRGRGINPLAGDEYERVIARRIGPAIPIFESVDGGPYQRASIDALKNAKEGATITIRKFEDVILEVRVGIAK